MERLGLRFSKASSEARGFPSTSPSFPYTLKGTVKIKPNISRSKYLSIFGYGALPHRPTKGFPNVYGARLAHRPLETFGLKYLVFS